MYRNVSRLISAFTLVFLGLVLAPGCGPSRHTVTGQVKYNGAPLNKSGGQIVFVGPDGTQAAAAIGADGSYNATGVVGGMNRVAVYYPNPALQGKRAKKGEPLPDPSTAPPVFLTPAAYASVETSGLSVDVKAGTVYSPELTGPPAS